MAMIDLVRFNGLRSRDWLVFKYPSEGLVLGAQLIVQEGQVAIFVKGGMVCDVFYSGTYTLTTENLPILRTVVNLPFGGSSPFSAEIYFINTATKLDMHWGTTDPVSLIDPKYFVKLRIRAFGQMGLKILEPVVFFKELIGGMRQDDIVKYDEIQKFYRGILVIKAKALISDAIISQQISALEISTKLELLSEQIREQITDEFAKYGFTVVNFYMQSINFPDEDFERISKILEEKAAFEIMGDGRYATKRSFDVYEGAVNNQNGVAGAFVAGGMGIGVSANMMQSLNHAVEPPVIAGNEEKQECPSCHTRIAKNARFCPECGTDLTKLVCECGNKLTPEAKFCPQCGRKVKP